MIQSEVGVSGFAFRDMGIRVYRDDPSYKTAYLFTGTLHPFAQDW